MCGEHDWTGGKCEHQEIKEHELPWFKEKDSDFQALQKLVLDPKFMESLKYYVRFGHTGILECVNNQSLTYCSKGFAFR